MKICTSCNARFHDNITDSTTVNGNLVCEDCFNSMVGRRHWRSLIDDTQPHYLQPRLQTLKPYHFGSTRDTTYYPRSGIGYVPADEVVNPAEYFPKRDRNAVDPSYNSRRKNWNQWKNKNTRRPNRSRRQ
jgi:hypothetical protein